MGRGGWRSEPRVPRLVLPPLQDGEDEMSAGQSRGKSREQELSEALQACIPWVASSGRGAAQEALAIACDLVGYDPFDWSSHPDVLRLRLRTLGWEDRIETEYRMRTRLKK